jgi:hypothetical protein
MSLILLFSPFTLFWERLKDISPKILEIFLIILLGFVFAWILKVVLREILKIIKFDNLCDRIGLSTAMVRANVKRSPTDIVGLIIYWLVIFWVLILSLSTLNVQVIDELTSSFLLYLPRFFIAVLVLIFGYFFAGFLGRALLIALVNAQVKSAKPISLTVQILILILFLTMGIEQLGIAKGVVVVTFSILLGGVVLALAIAFGLGGKDMAKDFLEKKAKSSTEPKKKPDEFSHI